MDALYITGTAGSGKSLLASRLLQLYRDNQSYPIILNLDPGALNLPYEPDVDVRDYIDIRTLMETYNLGPNGSLVMASDMIATRLDDIQTEVDSLNPDYVIIDTPGRDRIICIQSKWSIFCLKFSVR